MVTTLNRQPQETERERFDGFAVLELLGHRRLAGWLTEREIAGHGFLEINIPNFGEDSEQRPWSSTQFYSPQAVYSIIPAGKEEVMALARDMIPQPIQAWDVRSLLPEIKESVRHEIEDDVRREARARIQTADIYNPQVVYDADETDPPF